MSDLNSFLKEWSNYLIIGSALIVVGSTSYAVVKTLKENRTKINSIQDTFSTTGNTEQKLNIYSQLYSVSKETYVFSSDRKKCNSMMSDLENSLLPEIQHEILESLTSKNVKSLSELDIHTFSPTFYALSMGKTIKDLKN